MRFRALGAQIAVGPKHKTTQNQNDASAAITGIAARMTVLGEPPYQRPHPSYKSPVS